MNFRKRSFRYNVYSFCVFNEASSNLVKEYSKTVLNEEENISFYFNILNRNTRLKERECGVQAAINTIKEK